MNSFFQLYYLVVKMVFVSTLTILVMALTLLIGDIRKQLNENPFNVKAYCERADDTIEEFTKNLPNLNGETPNVELETAPADMK